MSSSKSTLSAKDWMAYYERLFRNNINGQSSTLNQERSKCSGEKKEQLKERPNS